LSVFIQSNNQGNFPGSQRTQQQQQQQGNHHHSVTLVAVSPKLLGIHDTAGATVAVVRARARTVVPSPCACEDAAEPLITAAAATSESEAKAFPISSEIFSKMLFRGGSETEAAADL
jgi:hypothetical protein